MREVYMHDHAYKEKHLQNNDNIWSYYNVTLTMQVKSIYRGRMEHFPSCLYCVLDCLTLSSIVLARK